jgi:hypothetical protein
MKTTMKYFLLLLALPAMLFAQYTGGNGGGSSFVSISSSPLPVELSSFTISTEKSSVSLKWHTATEVNNYGFDIERKSTSSWSKVAFVEGHGTTNAPQSYSYADNSASGKLVYRLKQIDRDGKFEYSKEVEATVVAAPSVFSLSQNYPICVSCVPERVRPARSRSCSAGERADGARLLHGSVRRLAPLQRRVFLQTRCRDVFGCEEVECHEMMRNAKSGTDDLFNHARQTPWLKTDNLIFRRSMSQDI